MTTAQSAMAGRALASLPCAPKVISHLRARRVNALMMHVGIMTGQVTLRFKSVFPGRVVLEAAFW